MWIVLSKGTVFQTCEQIFQRLDWRSLLAIHACHNESKGTWVDVCDFTDSQLGKPNFLCNSPLIHNSCSRITCNITVIISISSSRMTCSITISWVVSRNGFLAPLQLVFGLIIQKTWVSISMQNHLSAMTSKFPAAITDCQKETFDLPLDHGQQLTSSSHTDDSEDFHCEHFAVQNHLVVYRLSHTPNFEKQSRLSGITSRTHMHGSHEVYGELLDRYKANDHFKLDLFCIFSPRLEESQLLFVSTSVATSVDDELLRTRLTFFTLSSHALASLWPHFPQLLLHPFFGFLLPCSFWFLCLPLSQPHSIGIRHDSVALRFDVLVSILDMFDLRATRSVVRATTPEYDLKTNLNSVQFPWYSRNLSSSNLFPDTSTIQPDPPQLFPHAIRDQNIRLCSATMCKEMNCAVMTRAIFLSHCGVRDVRHTSSLTRDLILLITRLKENCAPRAHTAPTARQRDEPRTKCVGHATPTSRFSSASQALATRLKTDKFSILRVILKHTTRLRIHTLTHAWNILISSALTEWESRDCLTAIHMKPFSSSVFTNSRRDVSSSSWTAQIVRQGISELKLVEHLCLLGSTNTSLINQDWSHIHADCFQFFFFCWIFFCVKLFRFFLGKSEGVGLFADDLRWFGVFFVGWGIS